MMIPDFQIPTAALQLAAGLDVPGSYCDAQANVSGAFDGSDLVAQLLGLPASIPQALALCTPVDLSDAVGRRGYIIVNSAGRLGVAIGYGRVVEPCGRLYAITNDPATRWTAAYLPSTLERTMP